MIDDLVSDISLRIVASSGKKRSPTNKEYFRLSYAVRHLLTDMWKSLSSVPQRECTINLRNGYYSENQRYRDPNLTYRQIKSAYDWMVGSGLIHVTKIGFLDRNRGEGQVTRFAPLDELTERLGAIDHHPAIFFEPDLNAETIILRDTINHRTSDFDYKDTPKTDEYRANLKAINQCFLRHWADIQIKDSEYEALGKQISNHNTKQPIDLSKRTLVRIFSNGVFLEGGRFYRGWWQNVPSEYRKYITLDSKRTTEYDFSQINPHMIYYSYHKNLGSEDAYDRVLNGEHRDLVKAAFNALIQSATPLKNCPKDIDPSVADMSWAELRDRIIAAHKPIEECFGVGLGNRLQFEDSCIAESVMLHFASMDAPALPVHDSFIMHHGYAGELEEAMRRGFYERFKGDIPIKEEMLKWVKSDDSEPSTIDVDTIVEHMEPYSLWQKRHDFWWNRK